MKTQVQLCRMQLPNSVILLLELFIYFKEDNTFEDINVTSNANSEVNVQNRPLKMAEK